jgi:RNA polymerase sigma-70 factor (ECF subfamily)
VAASHVLTDRRAKLRTFVSLEDAAELPEPGGTEADVGRRRTIERLYLFIQQLKPLDREVILLYLEGTDAASIGEITGLSSGNVATKVHRIKHLLAALSTGRPRWPMKPTSSKPGSNNHQKDSG